MMGAMIYKANHKLVINRLTIQIISLDLIDKSSEHSYMHVKCNCIGTLTDICGLPSTCKYEAVVEIVHRDYWSLCAIRRRVMCTG